MTDAPVGLIEAFESYERAVVTNDLDALDAAFAPGAETMRGDPDGLLVGHETISAFRGLRGGVAPRGIERIEVRELGEGVALIMSVSRFRDGGTGLQTQVWQRSAAGRWKITAAHVAPRPRAIDTRIWRLVGDPLRRGAASGPLQGLRIAVKDVFAVEGFRIGAGNPAFLEEARPETKTAPAVTDLLRGGAALVGIARTDEFAYSIAGDNAHHGTPPNAALPGALPGGSSSGPAAAVAFGQADIALATDTAGSVRVPASYQGLWGLRTTHDLVPRQGLLPLAQSFDTVGWLSRDGGTMQRVVDWCLSYDGSETVERVQGESDHELPTRLLVPVELLDSVDAEAREAFEALLAALPAPYTVERVSLGDPDAALAAFRTIQGAEAWRNNGEWLAEHPGAVGDAVAERFRIAAAVTEHGEADARVAARDYRALLTGLVADGVLVLPAVPGAAPSRAASQAEVDDARTRTLRLTTPAALAGLPAVSAPLLRVPSPLGEAPLGLSLVARAGADIALVRFARALADALAPASAASTAPRSETP